MRLALVRPMVCGRAMFLASLYWLALLLLAGGGQVTATDVLTTAVFPMVASIVLLLGSMSGYRHVKGATTQAAPRESALQAGSARDPRLTMARSRWVLSSGAPRR